jgi:hypothetical protein
MIQSYSFGKIVVNGREYRTDLVIYPDGRIEDSWWRTAGHVLSLSDFKTLVDAKPDVVVAGTGAAGMVKVAPDVAGALAARQIEFHALPTGQATELYNELCRQKKTVGACLHLTC